MHDRDIYIYQTGEERLFAKVGQFDSKVQDWGVDVKGTLWALPFGKKVIKVKVVEERL